MRATIAISMSIALSATLAGPAFAEAVSINPTKDNTLYESTAGSLSNGAGEYFFAGRSLQAAEQTRRGVLAFDIAGSIPAGAEITSATLTLQMSRTIAGATDVSLHRLTADWGEGTSDAPGQEGAGAVSTAGDATWVHTFFSGSTWATPGGDFLAASSATTSVGAVGAYSWTGTGLIADVQNWLDNPTDNFGWLVMGDETTAGTAKRFNSRENSTSPPTLRIEYIPEPASAALLALGLLSLRRR